MRIGIRAGAVCLFPGDAFCPDEGELQPALVHVTSQLQKIEKIRVFERLRCEVRLRRGQREREVMEALPYHLWSPLLLRLELL